MANALRLLVGAVFLVVVCAGAQAQDTKTEMRHFARAKGDTIIQAHGTGPFKVNWVNPADVIPPSSSKK